MKRIFIIPVLLCLMLLIGCTQTPPANNPPAPNQTPPANATPPANNTPVTPGDNTSITPPPNPPPETPTQNVSLDQLYRFGSVNSYTYQLTSTSGGQTQSMNMTTSISADTLNGVAVWLEQTDVSTQGTTVTTKMWVDKTTYGCLNITTVIIYGTQTIEQAGQCPTSGPNSASTGETAPPLTYMGKESVTVPAGTYVADKYTAGGMTYWSSSSVPIPLKFVYTDGSATMELVSYT